MSESAERFLPLLPPTSSVPGAANEDEDDADDGEVAVKQPVRAIVLLSVVACWCWYGWPAVEAVAAAAATAAALAKAAAYCCCKANRWWWWPAVPTPGTMGWAAARRLFSLPLLPLAVLMLPLARLLTCPGDSDDEEHVFSAWGDTFSGCCCRVAMAFDCSVHCGPLCCYFGPHDDNDGRWRME